MRHPWYTRLREFVTAGILLAVIVPTLAACAPAPTQTPIPTRPEATDEPVATAPAATPAEPTSEPTPDAGPEADGAEIARSDRERIASPKVDQAALRDQIAANTAFGLDLYHAVRQEKEGNLFYSPYSISVALAMTYAGARGETEVQMARTLRFILPQEELHAALNALDQELAQRNQDASSDEEGQSLELHVANAIWGQRDYEFLPEFLDLLASNYGAGLRLVDFAGAPERARQIVNRWVSDQTEEKIQDLLPQGSVDSLTRLILTNAIYFSASWLHPFAVESTSDGTFCTLDGQEVTVPMMHQTEDLSYAKGDGYQAVELPYVGGDVSMVILLPDQGQFESFEESLDAEQMAATIDRLERGNVALTMPKFEFDTSLDLVPTLSEMGMPDAFSVKDADFSGMDGTQLLYVSDVLHKAYVAVDEAGTEAAAATAVVMSLKAAPAQPVEVTLDRPFIFLIRDVETGAILFIGRVVNPQA